MYINEIIVVNGMSTELLREIQKLHIRLERLIKKEEDFVKELQSGLAQFRELQHNLETATTEPDLHKAEELVNLKLRAIEAFNEVLKKGSDAEHEKSHLLESYGALILATERAFTESVS